MAGLAALMVLPASVGHTATHYVWLAGSNIPPYDSWATAATNIEYAVDAAVGDNDVVLVGAITADNYCGM